MSACRPAAAFGSSILMLLLFTTANAQSPQCALTIHVADPTGEPVRGARVAVSPRDARLLITRETDSAGDARFAELVPGTYVVEIAASGFAPAARPMNVRTGATQITVALELNAITEHVVVTGSGYLQTTSEISKAVTVIDAEEIAARDEFSVADALRTGPGTTVQQLGGPGSFTSVKLRGLREQDTAFLIDGVRFRDAASPQGDATAFIGELYITNLDRIEVLRGSGSSLYGSHAIGGAVNVITATGSGRPRADIGAETGSLGFSRITAHTGGGAFGDRLTFSLGAGHTRTIRGIDGDDEAGNTSIQGRSTIRLGRSGRATVRVYASDARSSINESPAAIGPLPTTGFVRATPPTFTPDTNDPDSGRESNFISTLLLFEQRPSSAFGYTLSLHRLSTDRLFHDGPLGISTFEPATRISSQFKGTIDTLNLRADRDWNRRQSTRLSYEFERERYLSDTVPATVALAWTADITQDSHAASVQHEVRLDALQVAGSVRAQYFALQDVTLVPAERAPFAAASVVTPPLALTADIASTRTFARTGTKLRGHLGNAYRAPAMFERVGVSFGSRGYSVYGDPGLEPEQSRSFDVGLDQSMARARALLSATWFYTGLTRVISFQSLDRSFDPYGRSAGYRSANGRTARGLEVGGRFQPRTTTHIAVAYTFIDAPPPAGDSDGLPRAAAVSAHQLSALVTQQFGALHVSLELEAAGDHYVTLFDPVSFGSRAYRFGGVARSDLAAAYRLPVGRAGTRLFAAVDNVFDRKYFVQGFRAAGRVARGGLAVAF